MLEAPYDADRSIVDGAAIMLHEVWRTYPGLRRRGRHTDDVAALAGVSLSVAAGEVVAVVGPSACGKTTLLELVCGLQRADAGLVQAAPAVLMPQSDLLLPWLTAIDNAVLAPRVAGVPRTQARALAEPWFQRFGLAGFEHAHVDELSGGMRQRVAFLRTLLAGKPILCLDEPFAALDAITRAEMQAWLASVLDAGAPAQGPLDPGGSPASGPLDPGGSPASGPLDPGGSRASGPATRERRTVLLVTHDVEEAVMLADRVIVMSPRPGRVVVSLEVALPRAQRRRDLPEVVTLRAEALRVLEAGG